MTVRLVHADCLTAMREMDACSIDACVTDPPYGLEFMGKGWDGADGFRRSLNGNDVGRDSVHGRMSKRGPEYRAGHLFQEFCEAWATETLRVLKPGGHLISFGGTRTYHRMACAIEDAGFEIRDQLQWIYGSGFPKSHNIGDGWGTALKPAHEPIVFARKPLIGTVTQNVREHGVGAINVGACRVLAADQDKLASNWDRETVKDMRGGRLIGGVNSGIPNTSRAGNGRWPANVIHDGSEEVLEHFPAEAGAPAPVHRRNGDKFRNTYGAFNGDVDEAGSTFHADSGSAARFFYCAKASAADRNDGLDHLPVKSTPFFQTANGTSGKPSSLSRGRKTERQNSHPTVKPTDLMRWLVRLVTPPAGVVLDPFMGSGSTGRACVLEGFDFIGIEREAEYLTFAEARIAAARNAAEAEHHERTAQPSLFDGAAA